MAALTRPHDSPTRSDCLNGLFGTRIRDRHREPRREPGPPSNRLERQLAVVPLPDGYRLAWRRPPAARAGLWHGSIWTACAPRRRRSGDGGDRPAAAAGAAPAADGAGWGRGTSRARAPPGWRPEGLRRPPPTDEGWSAHPAAPE